MALLHLVDEERIGEETIDGYFDVLYRVVCVGEKPVDGRKRGEREAVRSTYIVDWEQLVHLLEEYAVFGEDIVEVTALPAHDMGVAPRVLAAATPMARA